MARFAQFFALTSFLATDVWSFDFHAMELTNGTNYTSSSSSSSWGVAVVIEDRAAPKCTERKSVIHQWWYETKDNAPYGPFACTTDYDTQPWRMKAAYRSGGTENVHWKYTEDPHDPACLPYWTYYTTNGKTAKLLITKPTTYYGGLKQWCALPVYRRGGHRGKQWDYCKCD